MRVQTEEWRRFRPGIRMYRGRLTLFYNGENYLDHLDARAIERTERGESLMFRSIANEEGEQIQAIYVLPGVEVIHICAFSFRREKLEVVFMTDSVKRIENRAFQCCENLKYIQLSRSLEYIGEFVFWGCLSLTSIFIPQSCLKIGDYTFGCCKKLIILCVPQNTELGYRMIVETELLDENPFICQPGGASYNEDFNDAINAWIKDVNGDDDGYALHRACLSYNLDTEVIYGIVKRQGLVAFKKFNKIEVTPMECLKANTFAEKLDQRKFMKRYILDMMGEPK